VKIALNNRLKRTDLEFNANSVKQSIPKPTQHYCGSSTEDLSKSQRTEVAKVKIVHIESNWKQTRSMCRSRIWT